MTDGEICKFQSLSVIFFFSFVVQLLYHIGAMLWVVSANNSATCDAIRQVWFLEIYN